MSATFLDDLHAVLHRERVSDRPLDVARMAHDASHFLLHPQAVVVAGDSSDVQRAVQVAARHAVPVTFRSGGTSLSGQALTDGLLIDTRKGFRAVEVLDEGARVRCQPGATIRSVNARLAPYKRALGPDPASETACTVGGVVADNSSGMACGTVNNTYRTLDSIEVLLLSGTRIDTGAPDADEHLRSAEPALYEGLARLRDRVRGNAESVRRIRHQFSMKNTMGYGINAFLDADSPVDILAKLMVGSEGTLGFICSATFRTVPVRPLTSTALLVFDDIDSATRALPGLIAAGTATAELMDAASLKVAQHLPGAADDLVRLHVQSHTALLVEAQADVPDELTERVAALSRVVAESSGLSDAAPATFSTDPVRRAQAWQVRKGLYTAVAGARPLGSTALLEDVVVPMPQLPATVRELQVLCSRYGYADSVVFGHAKDANLHFMINPDLRDPSALATFSDFTDDLVDLILAADGSLKAEHGTGRIMAPFVERQYGSELYAVMREIKQLFDPRGTLNPGVIIGDDPNAHLVNLKPAQIVDPAVDRCVECGYCEPVCPSRDVTTTPRQRIVLMREMAAADETRAASLAKDFQYDAVDTCAVDSLCLLNCPVGIDTGVVMKGMRAAGQPPAAQRIGVTLAENWETSLATLRTGVGIAAHVPGPALTAVTGAARTVLPTDLVPLVGDDLPGPGVSRRTAARSEPGDVVFFASCMGELFGPAERTERASRSAGGNTTAPTRGASFAFPDLCDAAGLTVTLPDGLAGLCCGTVWRSKGLTAGTAVMARKTAQAVLAASRDSAIPVVTEASSCTHGLASLAQDLRAAGEDPTGAQVGAGS